MKNVSLLFFIIGVVLAFSAGFGIASFQQETPVEGVVNLEQGKPGAADFSLFWDAWRIVQERYAGAEELNHEEMVRGAIRGMVESLGDPYTVFLDPEDTNKFLEDISGTFEGVGMEIGIRENQLKVIAPLEGTPAYLAGLRAGDAIIEIDDVFARDISIDEAVSLIRGPKGSVVSLSILREGWTESRKFDIQRDVIEVPSLKWELKDETVAYIKISHFSQKAGGDFRGAVSEILASPADRIVLDLRNNPGGYLEISQEIAGWFLESGTVVTIEDFGDSREPKEYKAKGSARLASYPVVVLINEGSASASEILAGALRDNLAAPLIGKTSFGKGSVQQLEHLKDDSSLKVTVANWLTPAGMLISGEGLEPDIEVESPLEDAQEGEDPQLDKALEVVKGL